MRISCNHTARVLLGSLAICVAAALSGATSVAQAASPAESYIQDNVQKGLAILNDKSVSEEARRTQFQSFLESLTDIHRIALFTLGTAAGTASPADLEAFTEAFRSYAAAVYQQQLAH